jgi:hypothetical protein
MGSAGVLLVYEWSGVGLFAIGVLTAFYQVRKDMRERDEKIEARFDRQDQMLIRLDTQWQNNGGKSALDSLQRIDRVTERTAEQVQRVTGRLDEHIRDHK